MGVLDRWDRKNQETLEYHQDLEDRNGPADAHLGRQFLLVFGASTVLRFLLVALVGSTASIIVAAVAFAVLVPTSVVIERRKRQRWRDQRRVGAEA